MRSLLICSLITFSILTPGCNSRQDLRKLKPELDSLLKSFHGTAGLYVCAPRYSFEYNYNADSLFPSASMIKVPVLCTLWENINRGTLNPDSIVFFFADSLHYPYKGEDALARFKPGEDISVRQLMAHMISFSDNHASLYLQDLTGGGAEINQWLSNHGFIHTRVNSRTQGRESWREVYGWGQTTPREMATLLWKIRNAEILTAQTCDRIYRQLTRSYWDEEALSQIPAVVQAASKQGAVSRSRSEVVLVNAPAGDYVFCIITKDQDDTSWLRENEGFVLIRKISHLLWKHLGTDKS